MSENPLWKAADMPGLIGKTAIVTGANSGLGWEASRALARKGARVIMACRNVSKADAARKKIMNLDSDAMVDVRELDLSSLDSVRKFAESISGEIHILLNNAGVMAIPKRTTADGFEMQFGTNHLGHFALTGRLLDRLLAAPNARIVNVSSDAHRFGRKLNWDDLQWERRYAPWRAYSQSKLANLLFTHELDRKLKAKGAKALSVACHPGYAETNLQMAGPRMEGGSKSVGILLAFSNKLIAQSAEMGTLPLLYAATAPDIEGGEYIGPRGIGGTRGYPKKLRSSKASHNAADAARLWTTSEELTGVRYQALDA